MSATPTPTVSAPQPTSDTHGALEALFNSPVSPFTILTYLLAFIGGVVAVIWIVSCIYDSGRVTETIVRICNFVGSRFQAAARAVVAGFRRPDIAAGDGYVRPNFLGRVLVFHKSIVFWMYSRFHRRRDHTERTWPGYLREEPDLDSASIHFRRGMTDGVNIPRLRGSPRMSMLEKQKADMPEPMHFEQQRTEAGWKIDGYREMRIANLEAVLGRPLEGEEWRCIDWPVEFQRYVGPVMMGSSHEAEEERTSMDCEAHNTAQR